MSVLVLGFFAVCLALVTVVVAASSVFLSQRALSAAADGAAVAAAGALDEQAVYAGALGDALPLAQGDADKRVAEYVATAGLHDRFRELGWYVATDGSTASVTLQAVVPVPFVNTVTDAFGAGIAIEVTASSRAPVTP